MTASIRKELEEEISSALNAETISIPAANRIEVLLDDAFPEDDFMQDTVVMLAMYQPGGGEFLFDQTAMRKRLLEVQRRLSA